MRGSGRARRLRTAAVALLAVLLGAAGVGGYLLWSAYRRVDPELGRHLRERRLELPSSLYARPLVLAVGDAPRKLGAEEQLEAAGYRRVASPPVGVGEFSVEKGRWVIGRRRFLHADGWDEARLFTLDLDGRGRIAAIRDADSRSLPNVRLDSPRIGFFHGGEAEVRRHVPLSALPEHLVQAFLAIEDHRFFEHAGVDPFRILGAAFANLRAGRIVQGGSTITQQLARNVYLSRERVFSRKLQEVAIALALERELGKDEILEEYLDEVYLGQRGPLAIHGVAAASQHYFGQNVEDLQLHQAALLAALARGPTRYSPTRDPEAALERRNLVLRRMLEVGYLDEAAFESAAARPLDLRPERPAVRSTDFFADHVREVLAADLEPALLEGGALRVYTTLDWRLQRLAEEAVSSGLADLEARAPRLLRRDPPVEAALLALDPATGDILAMVGGRDYGRSQFNRTTQARRQPGSVFKAVVALAALAPPDPVLTLASSLNDEPVVVPAPEPLPGEEPEEDWVPRNHDKEFRGHVTLRQALEQSLNVPMVRVGQEVGLRRVIETARKLGIRGRLRPVPSLALGTFEVSLLSMTRAYAVLASGGVRSQARSWTAVTRADGGTLASQPLRRERVFGPREVYLVTSALEGAVNRGTGKSVRALGYRGPLAGKTGSSDDYRDGWFIGYTPELVVGVWVGFDDDESLGLSGAYTALPIVTRFLRAALGPRGGAGFRPPAGVEQRTVTARLGLGDGSCQEVSDWFVAGTTPHSGCGFWERLPFVGAGPPR